MTTAPFKQSLKMNNAPFIMIKFAVWFLSFFLITAANAYYSTLDTGEILPEGSYRTSLETQFITEGDTGVNFLGRFDSWLNPDANLRGVIGTGTTDLYLGGFYKWIPFPDSEGQPALGLSTGVIYARYEGIYKGRTKEELLDEVSLRIHPLMSKKISTEIGQMTPYASLPFGFTKKEGSSKIPVQLVGGVEWKTLAWKNITFIGEVGFNINQAFAYFSLGAQVSWNKDNGFSFD